MHISIDLLYLLYFKAKLKKVYLMKKLCVIVRGCGQLSVCHPFIIVFCVNPLSLSLNTDILLQSKHYKHSSTHTLTHTLQSSLHTLYTTSIYSADGDVICLLTSLLLISFCACTQKHHLYSNKEPLTSTRVSE